MYLLRPPTYSKYHFILCFLFATCFVFSQDQKPSKEEIMRSIMDINVSEEEAIDLLSKYYPELLNPVVEAKKDYDQANQVQNTSEEGAYYQTLGRKFLDKKDYDQAIIYFQKAIIQKKKGQNGSEKHPGISETYKDLGAAFEGKNNVEEALDAYQRGLISNTSDFNDSDLLSNPKTTDIISNSLAIPIFEAKGNLLLKSENDENKLLAALMSYERAIEILDIVCKKYTSEYTKLQLSQQITVLSEKAIQASLKLFQATRNKQYKKRIFSIVEKGKAMILTSALLESRARNMSTAPLEIVKREQHLKTRIAQLSQKIKSSSQKTASSKKAENKLFALNQALLFLQDSLKTYYPDHEYLKFVPPNIAIDSLQDFLAGKNAAIVEYFFGLEYAFAFTLTKDDFHIERLDDLKVLQQDIISIREDIQAQTFKKDATKSFDNFVSKAKRIYTLALEKALAPLDEDTKTLIIIPDGALWLIPFEILLYDQERSQALNFSPDNLPYLINKYSINYASSSKLLLKSSGNYEEASLVPFAGFAPEFESQDLASRSCFDENANLSKLDFNQTELEGIAPYFSGEAHFGLKATRNAFLNVAPNAAIIHLSTHACLNKEDPMDSRIFFSDQQYMTTEDIYALDIKAKMTVLSACQTGLGQVYNGEGMLSLSRAFAQAGCPSITMSLWPVADEATSEIMIHYYKNLDNGINKSEALRQAKLKYIEEQPKVKQHPYYWAAFIHLGDFSPIQTSKIGGMTFWLIVIGGLLVLGFFLIKKR